MLTTLKSGILDFLYEPGSQRSMRVFHTENGLAAIPLMAVGNAVFHLEKMLRKTRVNEVRISVSTNHLPRSSRATLFSALTNLVSYVLIEEVGFSMTETTRPEPKRIRTPFDLTPTRTVCLFSGGVDSTVGISLAAKHISGLNAVFCAHSDQSNTIRLVRELNTQELAPRNIPLRTVYVPRIEKQGYAQTRGFLYMLMAGAWMRLLNASKLLITEVGPTMYQPKFAPFDVVTLTTHPLVVSSAATVLRQLLGRRIEIVTPFEDLTKAEVFALAPSEAALQKVHSCISQRFGGHDGTCYGCVVRRLASIAARRPDVHYRRNPLTDITASRGNLLSLLRFSLDFLYDARGMENFEVGDIFLYDKEDLFRRFSLDNFAAIHSLVKAKTEVADDVWSVYSSAVSVLGGVRPLEERLAKLSSRSFVPSF